MSLTGSLNLLADGDWMELLWPIVLMVVYGVGAIVKTVAEKSKNKPEDAEEPIAFPADEKPRYKPLDQAVRPQAQPPKARTLPYARTAAGAPPSPVARPAAVPPRPAVPMNDRQRQEEIKRRRLEQIEAMRRQQQLQQRERVQASKAASPVPPQVPQGIAAARQQPVPAAEAVRKTPQEALRQVRTGQSVGVSGKTSAVSAQRAGQGANAPVRPETSVSTPTLLPAILKRRDTLRSAMVLKEILDRPLALRV